VPPARMIFPSSTNAGKAMIELLEGVRPGESPVLDEAMRLRHRVFVEEMGWEGLRRVDGRDTDQFDTSATAHHIAIVNGEVAGYQRFNATTGPHLLADVHQELCEGPSPKGPTIVEWSRYCVARKFKREGAFCDVASTLLIGAIEWGEPRGVEEFVLEFHPIWITRFLELGFDVKPLGLPREYDGDPTIAVRLRYGQDTYRRMLEMRGIQGPVLNVNRRLAARVA
jgi:acyl-homoserine lactone synthase